MLLFPMQGWFHEWNVLLDLPGLATCVDYPHTVSVSHVRRSGTKHVQVFMYMKKISIGTDLSTC